MSIDLKLLELVFLKEEMPSFIIKNYIAAKFSRRKIGSENVIRTSGNWFIDKS